MTRITPYNLDKWLFNLQEGNLSPAEKRELDSFLLQHPEFQLDADAWKASSIKEPLAPINFEADLHAIAGSHSVFAYRRWMAAAGLLLLLGSASFFIFFSEEDQNQNTTTGSESTNSFIQSFGNTSTNHSSTTAANHTDAALKNDASAPSDNDKNDGSTSDEMSNGENQSVSSSSDFQGMNKKNASEIQSANNKNNPSLAKDVSSDKNLTENQNSINRKNRQQVSIDIKNEVKIKTEKSVEVIDENKKEDIASTDMMTEEQKFAIESEKKAKLALKENQNGQVIAENKNPKREHNRKKDRYKLDPNPSFTNLRDPNLLMTNNHLVDQFGGFSGSMISSRFSMNYRNDWTGKSDINSQNMLFSYDKLMRKLKTGIGFTASYNNYGGGMFTKIGAALTISPKFKLGRGTSLEPSVTFSYAQKNVDHNRAIAGNFIEDRRGNVLQLYRNGMVPAATSAYMPDMKIGAVFQHKKFWAATSIDHLLTPKEPLYTNETNMYKNDMQFKLVMGTDYIHRPESGNVFSPQMSFYYHDGYTEMWMGTNARFKQVNVGASFSQYKDFLVTAGYQTPSFKMFYQFDMTRSMLLNEKFASHEIGVRFALGGNHKGSKSILDNER